MSVDEVLANLTLAQVVISGVRIAAAAVWLDLAIDIISDGDPATVLARRMTLVLIATGLVLLSIGSFSPWLISGEIMRYAYTVFSGFALVTGVSLRHNWRAPRP